VLPEGHPVGVNNPGNVKVSGEIMVTSAAHGKVAAADGVINEIKKRSMYIMRRRTESDS
jgi:hypothetical protein